MSNLIQFREETITTTYKYKTEHLDKNDWGTWEQFLAARENGRRVSPEEQRIKDTRKYGKCIVCSKSFMPADNIHFVQSVTKNSQMLGNLFACDDCADEYGNVNTATKAKP